MKIFYLIHLFKDDLVSLSAVKLTRVETFDEESVLDNQFQSLLSQMRKVAQERACGHIAVVRAQSRKYI